MTTRNVALALVFVAFAASAAVAQTDEKLLIAMKTGPDMTQPKMRDAIQNALKAISPSGNYLGTVVTREPTVKAITAATYNTYAALENPDFKPVDPPKSVSGKIELRQLTDADTWEFNLVGDDEREISRLDVSYADAPDKPVSLTPSRKKDDPLTLSQFGTYRLKTDPKRTPSKYTATVRKLGETAETTESGGWPEGSTFYLIRLDGLSPQYQQPLARAIKDPNSVGAALSKFDIKRNVTLAVGDADAGGSRRKRGEFEGNRLFVSVPPLDQQVSQAYIRFPLSADDAATELKRLNDMSPNELAAHISKERFVAPDSEVVVTADMKPKWIKLPPVTTGDRGLTIGHYGRVLYLATAGDKLARPEEYQKLLSMFTDKDGKPQDPHWVVVYEFEDPLKGIRTAVPAALKPDDKPRLANDEPINLWAAQLTKLAGQPPLKAPVPKDDAPPKATPKDDVEKDTPLPNEDPRLKDRPTPKDPPKKDDAKKTDPKKTER